ncbi:MAG: NOB1 family endonuclease [Candidatus Lokiarchaeia archaeon]
MSDQQGKNFEISYEKNEIYVLDSSALIGGYNPNLTNAQHFIAPSIFEEAIDEHSRMILNLAVSNEIVKVRTPTPASIKSVKNDAKNTGDLATLSTIDIEVLALALDLKKENRNPIILTDDYALQNVAEILGIAFKTIIREGIKQRFIWTRYCPSCKKQYPDTYSDEICEICGGKLKRRVLRKGK